MSTTRPNRALVALATAAVGTAVVTTATPAGAVVDDPPANSFRFFVDRVAGADRYETAALLAARTDQDGEFPTFALARGDAPADALTAAQLGLPVLLTRPGSLPAATRDVLAQAEGAVVVVIGGEAAVSPAVVREVEDLPSTATVFRLAGADRYATASAVAAQNHNDRSPAGTGLTDEPAALLASGTGFTDAVAAGPLAAGGGEGPPLFPLLLTRPGDVPQATLDALADAQVRRVVVLGGPAAVDPAVDAQLAQAGYVVERLAGANRYETAALVADRALDLGLVDPARFTVARGDTFPDALTAGSVRSEAVLLVDPRQTTLPAATEALVADLADVSLRATVVGGTTAVPEVLLDEVRRVSAGPGLPGNRVDAPEAVLVTAAPGDTATRSAYVVGFDQPVVPGLAERLVQQRADGVVVGRGVGVEQQGPDELVVVVETTGEEPGDGPLRLVDLGGLAVEPAETRAARAPSRSCRRASRRSVTRQPG